MPVADAVTQASEWLDSEIKSAIVRFVTYSKELVV